MCFVIRRSNCEETQPTRVVSIFSNFRILHSKFNFFFVTKITKTGKSVKYEKKINIQHVDVINMATDVNVVSPLDVAGDRWLFHHKYNPIPQNLLDLATHNINSAKQLSEPS